MKLIFTDTNKELIKAIKKENIKEDNFRTTFVLEELDVLECKKKYPNAKIVTASNPDFSAGAGLDKLLKDNYGNEWKRAKEFSYTENLFFVISIDSDIKSSISLIKRALFGVMAYNCKFDLILTGIGTGIGGLEINDFIQILKNLLNLSYANLSSADLSYANLSSANLRSANLRSANLSSANLSSADLSSADLSSANLSSANLSSANLRSADLRSANLSTANLSKIINFPNKYESFIKMFKFTKNGMICYKAIDNTDYPINEKWKIDKEEYLEENVNPCVPDECGCGVNFGTLEYVEKHYPNSNIWKCLIEIKDLCAVVVPYNTDGKARCSRLKLIKCIRKVK